MLKKEGIVFSNLSVCTCVKIVKNVLLSDISTEDSSHLKIQSDEDGVCGDVFLMGKDT